MMDSREPSEATRLFIEAVSSVPEGGSLDIEALCRAHPEQAETLRERYADWQLARTELAVRDGRTISVSRSAASDAAWEDLIEQLGARGPAHQRYVFRGEIARGGMGVIHRVYDQDVRRPLAMKVILRKEDAPPRGDTPDVDDRTLGRFLEEAQVTGQLDHPGIVPVHERDSI